MDVTRWPAEKLECLPQEFKDMLSNKFMVLIMKCVHCNSEEAGLDLEQFLSANPDIDVNDTLRGRTPLHCIARRSDPSHRVISTLLDRGADINAIDNGGCSPLHFLCQYCTSSNLKSLVEFMALKGAEINTQDAIGYTPLHYLCYIYSALDIQSIIEVFVSHGADLTIAPSDSLATALHLLCQHYNEQDLQPIIEYMVEHGASLLATDDENKTPLDYLLERNGANQNLAVIIQEFSYLFESDQAGRYLLHASKIGCWKTVEILLPISKNLVTDFLGKTALDYLEEYRDGRSYCICVCCRIETPEWEAVLERLRRLEKQPPWTYVFPREKLEEFIAVADDWFLKFSRTSRLETSQQLKSLLQNWESGNCSIDDMLDFLDNHAAPLHNTVPVDNQWVRIPAVVYFHAVKIVEILGELDGRFTCTRLLRYGSSAEKCKLLFPDEFDFMMFLEHFHGDSGNNVQCKSGLAAEVFQDKDGCVSSSKIVIYIAQLVSQAAKLVRTDNLYVQDVLLNESCITLQLFLGVRDSQPFQLCFDLTVGIEPSPEITGPPFLREVFFRSFQIKDKDLSIPAEMAAAQAIMTKPLVPVTQWCRVVEPGEKSQYLVAHRNTGFSCKWRLSYPSLERDTVLHNGPVVQRCFQLIKLLVLVCNSKSVGEKPDRKTSPSSYAIKTCLFHRMRECPPPWKQEALLEHCKGICKWFLMSGVLASHFMKDAVEVYEKSEDSRRVMQQVLQFLQHNRV